MEDKFKIKKHTMFIPDQVYRRAVRALIKSVTQRKGKPLIKQARRNGLKEVRDNG